MPRIPTSFEALLERPAARRHSRAFAAKASDLLPLCDFAGLLLASYVSISTYGALIAEPDLWNELQRLAWIAATVAPFILYDAQFAAVAAAGNNTALARGFVRRSLMLLAAVSAIAYAGRWLDDQPPGLLLWWAGCTLLFTAASRVLLAWGLRRLTQQGALAETIAVVGSGDLADRLIPLLIGNAVLFGVFDDRRTRNDSCVYRPDATLEGLMARITRAALNARPDRILLALPGTAELRLLSLRERLRPLKIPVDLCAPNISYERPSQAVAYVGDWLPVTLLADRPIKRWNSVLKATEDFVLSSIITLLLLPVLACIALAIKLDSPGPILFMQRRHGFNNGEFNIYKFRTMLCATQGSGQAMQQTVRGDDRITRIGRFLRKYSLDELPQLFNVLEGAMSLVGPRPHAVNMRTAERLGHEITDVYLHRHRVKPGITGWAQVNGSRGATHTTEKLRRRVELDLHYVENWSLLLDLKIMCLTVGVVLRGNNAY